MSHNTCNAWQFFGAYTNTFKTNNFMHSTHFFKITWSMSPPSVPLQPPYHTLYELQDTVYQPQLFKLYINEHELINYLPS